MSASRSPNYPSLSLDAAIDIVRAVFERAHRTIMSRMMLARHMGYQSLNGRVLTRIAALRAFGLVVGQGQELRVSEDTITILQGPKASLARQQALTRCAFHSALFKRVIERFPGSPPNESDLEHWLVARGFRPKAAANAAAIYLATMTTLAQGNGAYHLIAQGDRAASDDDVRRDDVGPPDRPYETTRPSLARREVISLAEGDVTITYPDHFSIESYEDLAASLELFLKRARRRAAPQDRS